MAFTPFITDNKALIWQQAEVVVGYDSNVWRKDAYGCWIKYTDFNKTNSKHGWYVVKLSKNGKKNFMPVHVNHRVRRDAKKRSMVLSTIVALLAPWLFS